MKRIFYAFILILLASTGAIGSAQAQYVILRKQILYASPNCFEFYLADTQRTDAGRMAFFDSALGVVAPTDYAARQGWEVDPNAPGPYREWEAGDYVMSILSRFGGDWYGCLGARLQQLPAWATPQSWTQSPPTPTGTAEGYCILRKPILNWPPNCFEFYLADPRRTDLGRMVSIDALGLCTVTDYAARQGWEVDPSYGGPYPIAQKMQANVALMTLNKHEGDFYGCRDATELNDLFDERDHLDDRGLFDDPNPVDAPDPFANPGHTRLPWTTYSTSGWGDITFHREGPWVATYEGDTAHITGSLSGTVLEGYWVERGAAERCKTMRDGSYYWGRVRFVFTPDFSSFRGRWSYCNKPLPDSDHWNGSLK